MKISRTPTVAALFLLAAATSAQAFEFYADEFRGVLNGAATFLDTFDGGATPPVAPKFLTNTPLTPSYNLSGSFAAPSAGKLPFTTACSRKWTPACSSAPWFTWVTASVTATCSTTGYTTW